MRLLPPALLLGFGLACGGASVVSPTLPAGVERGADGQWPATAEGVCAHLVECGCSPVPSYAGCVAQHELGAKAVGGVLDLQEAMIDAALEGESGPEAELVRAMTAFGGELVEGGMAVSMREMASMECAPLCAELERQRAELALE